MSATKILWGQITTAFLIALLTAWGATQWTAWRLGFQARLATPWFQLAGWPGSAIVHDIKSENWLLSPRPGLLKVSRSETARPLLTPAK